ncbi:MAG: SCO family protein [Pirellulales bacterium]
MGPATKYWLLLACLLVTMYGSFVLLRRDQAGSRDAPPTQPVPARIAVARPAENGAAEQESPIEDFVLTDQEGQPFDSRTLQGKVWVGSFFFTNCPAICWRLNQALAALQETSPESETHFVSITCDPQNDTPAALAKYAAHFKADPQRWTFLTGDMDLIRSIGNDSFKVAVETNTHSDRAFVVDRNGKVRGRFRLTEPDQIEMLRKLLEVVEAEPVADDVAAPSTEPAEPAEQSESPQPAEQSDAELSNASP